MQSFIIHHTTEVPTLDKKNWPSIVETCIVEAENYDEATWEFERDNPERYIVYVSTLAIEPMHDDD